jgi:hypothetical protein
VPEQVTREELQAAPALLRRVFPRARTLVLRGTLPAVKGADLDAGLRQLAATEQGPESGSPGGGQWQRWLSELEIDGLALGASLLQVSSLQAGSSSVCLPACESAT